MNFLGGSQKMLEQAKEMQDRIQREMALIRVEASTGGGMVTITMDGKKYVTSVVIDPIALDDVEMLQDMVRGAVNEASKRVDEKAQSRLSSMMGGMLGGLPSKLAD